MAVTLLGLQLEGVIDGAAVNLVESLKLVAELREWKQRLTDGRRTIAGGVEFCYPASVWRSNSEKCLVVGRKRNI